MKKKITNTEVKALYEEAREEIKDAAYSGDRKHLYYLQREAVITLYRSPEGVIKATISDNYNGEKIKDTNAGIMEWIVLKEAFRRKKYTKAELIRGIQSILNEYLI